MGLGTGIDWRTAIQSIPVPNSHSGADYLLPDEGGAGGSQIAPYFGYRSHCAVARRRSMGGKLIRALVIRPIH
jgi:hypothetical protein